VFDEGLRMSLTVADVQKVAKLARLEMAEADLATMADQLNRILEYVDQLSTVNTDGVEPLAHPLPVQNIFREDVPKESLPLDAALQNAPNRLGEFFGVPAVFDSDDPVSH
jgi:aspartyl-tRNA(Asn)/glutamyl-tRNA(Gln) amidotransferase subunit C